MDYTTDTPSETSVKNTFNSNIPQKCEIPRPPSTDIIIDEIAVILHVTTNKIKVAFDRIRIELSPLLRLNSVHWIIMISVHDS
jgi:hypothetical protein